MRHLRFLLSVVLFTTIMSPSWAGNEAGLPGEFLNFGIGARPMGMGRAFTGVADDVDSIYFNPAGLATFRSSQLTFSHNPMPVDGDYQFVGYSQPLYAYGNLGVGVVNMTSGDVTRTDVNNTDIGLYSARETGYLLSYANKINDKWSGGATLKMAENKIDNLSERGYGADLGTLYQLNDRVRFGAMLRNALAPHYDFETEKDKFPTIFHVGSSVKFLNEHLLTALDLEKTIGETQGLRWHFGMEGHVIKNIYLRAGIDQTEITSGVGIGFRSMQFDYAAGFQDLGFINRFSVKFLFGGYEVDIKATPEVFSPIGLKNKVTFRINTANRNRIVKWIMTIRDPKDNVVNTFQGFNSPPEVMEWDGKDAQGKVVKAGRYTYRMTITDTRNRMEKTPVRSIRVEAPTPFEIEAK